MTLFYRTLLLFFLFNLLLTACDEEPTTNREYKSVEQEGMEAANKRYFRPAFDFPPNLAWLNVSRPLTLDDLKGRISILDFWTYGCINCLHANQKLQKLKQQYGDQILIISIHTPKFDNEKNLQTLRRNVLRFEMEHPVVNDTQRLLAKSYQVKAWPSFVVLNQQAEIVGKTVGESRVRLIAKAVKKILKEEENKHLPVSLPMALEKNKTLHHFLLAPTKIDINKEYVAISDSLHHRIIMTDHQGKIQHIYGGQQKGLKNGQAQKAQFNQPQGIALTNNGLYIADSGNHLLRFIHFKNNIVTTIAGGAKHIELLGTFDTPIHATKTALSSPWDLSLKDNQLYIAMAGSHQIWRYNIHDQTIQIFAGTGKEGLDNGHYDDASFSQPFGLSAYRNKLYVADSESSALRVINLQTQQVSTLTGTGLFDFGDQDGTIKQAKLQHPSAISPFKAQQFLISDTYNHKIKQLDLKHQQITTLIGNGKAGINESESQADSLNEPNDIAIFKDLILIADTNNDRIIRYWPKTNKITPWIIYE